jgi:hypothetical protein
MPIIIKYEELTEIINDKKIERVKILKIKGLTKEQLPKEYLDQIHNIYCAKTKNNPIWKNKNVLLNKNYSCGTSMVLSEKFVYHKSVFLDKLKFIKKCGEKLRKINKQLKLQSEQKPIRKTIKI